MLNKDADNKSIKNVDDKNTCACGDVSSECASTKERYVMPQVDIYGDTTKLVLVADVPGASKDSINVKVDDGVLTLEANTAPSNVEGVVYSEFEQVNYYRQFEIADGFHVPDITADLKDGVLTLQLPKAPSAQPRTIDVTMN